MDKLEQQVLEYIKEHGMFSGVSHCVCGVSGGADSVCLLTVLSALADALGIQIHVVHINHMIRGAEADSDEAYVNELCEKYGVTCDAFHIDVPKLAADESLTVEEAGRKARYESFRTVCAKYENDGGCVTAVAHNMSDVAETVLFNLARGTGMGGMKGIPPVRDGIVRPLLCCRRCDIEAYLDRKQTAFCMDSTNIGDDYSRNRIRHVVLPALAETNDRAVEHIYAAAEVAAEYERLAENMADSFLTEQGVHGRAPWERKEDEKDRYGKQSAADVTAKSDVETDCNDTEYSVDMDALKRQDRLIQELVIKRLTGMACGGMKDVGRSHVHEVMKLLSAQTGAGIDLPYGARAYVSYGRLVFQQNNRKSNGVPSTGSGEALGENTYSYGGANADVCIDISAPGVYDVPGGRLEVEIFDKTENLDLSKKEYTKYLDYAKINTSVRLRTYRAGDYIVVDAFGARKKVNRLYTDCKIPAAKRDGVLLAAAGAEILWVIGVRMSEAYKVTDETEKVMKLEYVRCRSARVQAHADQRD